VRALPRRAALASGGALGRVWAALDPRHRAIAADHLRRAFPDWPEARVRAVARGVYAHFGRVLLDLLWLQGRGEETVRGLLQVEGREHVEAAQAAGHGVVMTTAHIGNWEFHGLSHGLLFGALGVVARPLDNPALDRRLCALRTRFGNTVIYKRRALVEVIRLLRAGRGVAFLLDQNVEASDGVFVEFFGRPAATTTVAAALALKTGAPIVPSCCWLDEDGRYRLVYEAPIWADPGAPRDAELFRLTQAVTARLEAFVRQRPAQWLWIHRRWKTQPAAAGAPA
jgi:KDO2-lipid IV(A) lauroyltransferase